LSVGNSRQHHRLDNCCAIMLVSGASKPSEGLPDLGGASYLCVPPKVKAHGDAAETDRMRAAWISLSGGTIVEQTASG
jgi:hypothetical protein